MKSGDTIGRYRLLRQLGRGGMGEVWLATAGGYGGFSKTVVVKTLLPELASDRLFVEMLAQEARICAKLSHPNLIEVFDFTEHGGIYLLAMEHVSGEPLSRIMQAAHERACELPPWFALRVAWECCRGLEYAHAQGIIHCDLSPSNVMVTYSGITKILDFGVAHSSARGPKADRLKGKFPYIAPERIKSLATDRRTDIYALGVMLYLLFTGRLPFSGKHDGELLHKIVTRPPRPPSQLCAIDPAIERIIMRAMQPDPVARYQTAGAVISELAPCLEGQLGAYGQHDVAALVGALFDVDAAAVNARVDLHGDDLARPPGENLRGINELSSVVVDLESSDLEIARDPLVVPAPLAMPAPLAVPAPLVASARASSAMKPLVVFETTGDAPRSSVQDLFGQRPTLALSSSNVFESAPLAPRTPFGDGAVPSALGSAPGRWLDGEPPMTKAPTPEPMPEPEPEPEPDRARGVFGGYSPSARPAAPTLWPWPSSRTKS